MLQGKGLSNKGRKTQWKLLGRLNSSEFIRNFAMLRNISDVYVYIDKFTWWLSFPRIYGDGPLYLAYLSEIHWPCTSKQLLTKSIHAHFYIDFILIVFWNRPPKTTKASILKIHLIPWHKCGVCYWNKCFISSIKDSMPVTIKATMITRAN